MHACILTYLHTYTHELPNQPQPPRQEKQNLIEAGDEAGAKALEEKAQAAAAEAEAKEELDMENLDVPWTNVVREWLVNGW